MHVGRRIARLLAPSPPAICSKRKADVICYGVGQGHQDFRPDCLTIFLSPAALAGHEQQLLSTAQDCRDGSDQAEGIEAIGRFGNIPQVGAKGLDKVGNFELRCHAVQDIEARGERQEGNGEMDRRRVQWVAVDGQVSSCYAWHGQEVRRRTRPT